LVLSGAGNGLSYAVRLALLPHPGMSLAHLDQPADTPVTRMGFLPNT
jgi:hypothetical protein